MATIGTTGSCYFAHDANAMQDSRIVRLRRQYGYEGIGIYWALIELLRQADSYQYEFDPELIADALRIPDRVEIVSEIIANDNFDLFEINTSEGIFYSLDLNGNMFFMEAKRQRLSESGAAGAAITNFKLYGIIPDSWSDDDILNQWNALTKDEQYRLGEMMKKPTNKKHKDRLNAAVYSN